MTRHVSQIIYSSCKRQHALKQMNQQNKRKSFVLLDEAPTLYIPKFELIPATARSNRVASVYMAQDIAQMNDMHGREKAEAIIANLSNQFYGKVSSVQTARMVSEMIGKEECTERSKLTPCFRLC